MNVSIDQSGLTPPVPPRNPRWQRVRRFAVALVVVILSFAITIMAWRYAVNQREARLHYAFEQAVAQRVYSIESRLDDASRTLHAFAGLIRASERVETNEWRAFVKTVTSPSRRGALRGLAMVDTHPSDQILRVRYRRCDLLGSSFHAINLVQSPEWADAVNSTRGSGRMYLISEDQHLLPEAPSRRMTFVRWVGLARDGGSEWVAADIDLDAVLGPLAGSGEDARELTVVLLEENDDGTNRLLHADSNPASTAFALSTCVTLPMSDMNWHLHIRATPAFFAARRDITPNLILGIGLIASLLGGWIVSTLSRRENAAVALAARVVEDLHATEEEAGKLALVASRTDNAVLILDSTFRVEWANESFLRQINRRLSDITGERVLHFVEIDEPWRDAVRDAASSLAAGRGRSLELRVRFGERKWCWMAADLQPTVDASGQIANFIVVARDVTVRRESEAVLLHRSTHDDLTGLANRVAMMERLYDCLSPYHREQNRSFAVIFFDLDRFKVINDSLGHAVGDRFLAAVARRLQQTVAQMQERLSTESITAARLGGDEFTVLIEGMVDSGDPLRVARQIQQAIALPFDVDGQELTTTASMGVAISNPRYRDAEDVLRDADIAMYRAKSLGRARIEIFDQAMHEDVRERMKLETDLRRALDRDELEVHYQPIVNLSSGDLTGFEALVRWRHPTRGLVSPALFIPIAEESGLIVALGRRVLSEACHQLSVWQERFAQIDHLSMSVNLSVKQLADPLLFKRIESIVATSRIKPGTLKLEITESAIMDDLDAMRDVLNMLKTLNVQLWMDDFGTGYSSLSCLHQFPIDGLKIDRSFVQTMNERRDLAAVVMSIVALAHHLRMPIVAEGVETNEQLLQLQALECDYGQGYYFSRPLPRDEADHFIREYLRRDGRWAQENEHADEASNRTRCAGEAA